MSIDTRMHYAPNLALGICILVVGIALTLDTLHILEAGRILRFWPVGLVLLGAGVVAQSWWPAAEEPGATRRRRPSAAPLLVLVIIFGFLVGPRLERRGGFARSDALDTVSLFAVMGEDNRTSTAAKFRGGEMTSVMGSNKLDLRQATLAPGEEAVIDVFTMMGGVELRVPDGWTVVLQTVPVMGGVKDQRPHAGDGRVLEAERPPAEADASGVKAAEANASVAAPRLVVRGLIIMGGLVIKS